MTLLFADTDPEVSVSGAGWSGYPCKKSADGHIARAVKFRVGIDRMV